MPDKTIIFTARAVYDVLPAKITYEIGQIETMREDLANRWITRGVATDDAATVAAAQAAKAPSPVAADPVPDAVVFLPSASDPPAQRGRRGSA